MPRIDSVVVNVTAVPLATGIWCAALGDEPVRPPRSDRAILADPDRYRFCVIGAG